MTIRPTIIIAFILDASDVNCAQIRGLVVEFVASKPRIYVICGRDNVLCIMIYCVIIRDYTSLQHYKMTSNFNTFSISVRHTLSHILTLRVCDSVNILILIPTNKRSVFYTVTLLFSSGL